MQAMAVSLHKITARKKKKKHIGFLGLERALQSSKDSHVQAVLVMKFLLQIKLFRTLV